MAFDAIFNRPGIRVIDTLARARKANAIAERWIGTVRRERLGGLVHEYKQVA